MHGAVCYVNIQLDCRSLLQVVRFVDVEKMKFRNASKVDEFGES